MDIDQRNDRRIIASWHTNAAPWTRAVREGQIETRREITDRAVLEAIASRAPGSVIDLGCGEGWLARALDARGVRVLGLDAVPALIEQAARAGGGQFRLASYADIAAGAIAERADLVVCNFSLLGRESVTEVLRAVPGLLRAAGTLVIQTLHPLESCGDQPYRDGWREGSWRGFDPAFREPAPWYFRTLESWIGLLRRQHLALLELREPLHPRTQRPASAVFIAQPQER